MLPAPTAVLGALLGFLSLASGGAPGPFTNEWVVRIKGGALAARALAAELGYQNVREIRGFEDTYLMRKLEHPPENQKDAPHLTKRLALDVRVVWAEQLSVKTRVKRGYLRASRLQLERPRFNDELWPHQWYLHDTRNMPRLPELDHHVTQVWDRNITGREVVVSILDDGLEWNHTDIYRNYDPKASYDLNDKDDDPFPRYDEYDSNNHGTRCAGEVSMIADNKICGVGVAYNSKIGGIRMLDGTVDDVMEAEALAFNLDHIDIFSASWGPKDDGMTVEGPGTLTSEAIEKGIVKGRKGKGALYVWASGNGGRRDDNCNCDGYANSPYTLSVGSANQHGQFPWYGERCSSTMVVTFSSGAYTDQMISTADLHGKCTTKHTGTSAAAPLAAGIFALVLEANPDLTWRDVQHLAVWTTDIGPILDNRGWRQNGVGLLYNHRFGFGLLNADRMVRGARQWTPVPERVTCTVVANNTRFPLGLESGKEVKISFTTDGCRGTDNELNFLEHVMANITVKYDYRGALDIFLFSPAGTLSMLLSRRKNDKTSDGFEKWPFMSVHFWGERPEGTWTLIIRDKLGSGNSGRVNFASLTLSGTLEKPAHVTKRSYHIEGDIADILEKSEEYDENDDPSYTSPLPEQTTSGSLLLDWADLIGKDVRRSEVDSNRLAVRDYEIDEYYYGENGYSPDFY